MKNPSNIQTIGEVIQELGGTEAVRRLTKRKGVSAVLTWKYRNKFPFATYTTIQGALQQKGKTAPNSLWGMQ